MIFSSPLSKLFEDFGQIFDETGWAWNAGRHQVAVNIWSNDKQLVVQAELPGIDPAAMELSIIKDRLLLKAERKLEAPEQSSIHQSERSAQHIERSIQLPYEVDAESANAEYKDGILHLTIDRVQVEKPQLIKIKVK